MGLRRFSELQQELGIAKNILSERLKRLVAEGILEKTSRNSGFSEYRLTEKGLALQPILLSMTHWGDKYRANSQGKRLVFIDRRDNKPIQSMAVRSHDGRKLSPKEVKARQGPGYRSNDADAPLGK